MKVTFTGLRAGSFIFCRGRSIAFPTRGHIQQNHLLGNDLSLSLLTAIAILRALSLNRPFMFTPPILPHRKHEQISVSLS
jgi:hypothetical protein|tara:strand:+ start:2352 stop:2591 length:240 start_codon:yes stop_codon:yes gene_type:complete